jgi:hypothetical protein
METPDDAPAAVPAVEAELNELLGLFDAPAFARRGQELEHGLERLHARCARQREAMLELVRIRLRQWAGAVAGPGDWGSAFAAPIEGLWPLSGAEPPAWAGRRAPDRRRRAIARDLVASVERFNRRWTRFVAELDLSPFNRMIDQYNHYYLLEKECVLGSSRLAARHFVPRPRLTAGSILDAHPLLPVPELRG